MTINRLVCPLFTSPSMLDCRLVVVLILTRRDWAGGKTYRRCRFRQTPAAKHLSAVSFPHTREYCYCVPL